MLRAPVALMLACLLAGCFGPGTDSTTSASAAGSSTSAAPPSTASCPRASPESPLANWTVHGGLWAEGAAPATGPVVCGVADRALSALVDGTASYGDVDISVQFQMLEGDSGAGVVLHYASESDYNIVRYSPREQGWHLFTMVSGNRQKQDDASVTPPTTNPELGEWVMLRVQSRAGHIQAWHGDVKVIDYHLEPEASRQGRVGYFLRDHGMAANFADLSAAAPAPASAAAPGA